MNKVNYWLMVFFLIIGTFSVIPYVFADMTAEEIMEEGLYDGEFIIKGTSTDGSVIVLVGTERPVPPNFWGMSVMFADAKSGAVIEHVNYDLFATQENSWLEDRNPENLGTALIIDMKDQHLDNGISGVFGSRDYLFSEDPIDIKITLQGIGIDTKSGPIGDVITMSTDQQRISEKKCRTAELSYDKEKGYISSTCYANPPTLTVQIESDSENQITIDIPKQIVYSIANEDCEEDKMMILIDGEVIDPEIISSKTMNTITIPVQEGAHEIEFIGTVITPIPSPAQYCGIVMGYETQYLPPRLQMELGMEPELVKCNQGLELAIKTYDESAICVTPLTKEKLVERNVVNEK